MSRVIEIEDHEHYDKLLAKTPKLIIFFGAKWCSHCQKMKPVFEQISNNYKNVTFAHLEVTKVHVEKVEEHGFPVFVCYSSSDATDVLVGAYKDKLMEMINKFSQN